MDTIAVFGASGRTGRLFTEKALKDYKVKALVRNPEKLLLKNENLEIIQGDILNKDVVAKTIRNTSAVVSLIGLTKNSPANLHSRATQYIIAAMETNGIKRLISLTGGGVRDPKNDAPKFMDKLIVFLMKNVAGKGSRNALLDAIRHVELIKKSDLDWTIVRGPMLTLDTEKGSYQVGYVGKVEGFKLTRADLASFILDILKNNKHIKDMPFLSNGK